LISGKREKSYNLASLVGTKRRREKGGGNATSSLGKRGKIYFFGGGKGFGVEGKKNAKCF